MKTYTLTLVTLVPFTQTVTVDAENQDEAIHASYDLVDVDKWVQDETYDFNLDDVDVEAISPEDEEDEN